MKIDILSSKANHQEALVDGVHYFFEFSLKELANNIIENNSITDLEFISGLDSDDYNSKEMAEQIADEWNDNDLSTLISDFIVENPNVLEDHLISNK